MAIVVHDSVRPRVGASSREGVDASVGHPTGLQFNTRTLHRPSSHVQVYELLYEFPTGVKLASWCAQKRSVQHVYARSRGPSIRIAEHSTLHLFATMRKAPLSAHVAQLQCDVKLRNVSRTCAQLNMNDIDLREISPRDSRLVGTTGIRTNA